MMLKFPYDCDFISLSILSDFLKVFIYFFNLSAQGLGCSTRGSLLAAAFNLSVVVHVGSSSLYWDRTGAHCTGRHGS